MLCLCLGHENAAGRAYIGMAYVLMAFIGMAYVVMACRVKAYVVMACIFKAYRLETTAGRADAAAWRLLPDQLWPYCCNLATSRHRRRPG